MLRTRNWVAILTLMILILGACSSSGGTATDTNTAPAPTVAQAEPQGEADSPVETEGSDPAASAQDSEGEEAPTDGEIADGESATEAEASEPETAATGDESLAAPVTRTYQILPEQSEASYAVDEEFFNRAVRFVTAVGRTNTIEGEIELSIEGTQLQMGSNRFVVDLRTLTSDSGQRDRRIRSEWLESNSYPWAEFYAEDVQNFPADAAEGREIQFQLAGQMTIREVTQPLVFDVTARLDGDTLTAQAESFLYMRDFGFEPPSILGMLTVSDGVTLNVEIVAQATE